MPFEDHLAELLPADLPQRDSVLINAARHLHLIAEANQRMNLTRILDPREAVIKHVIDSVLPWRFFSGAKRVLDAGTGAGLPGIPLALVLPETQFILTDSTQKKARFVESVAEGIGIENIEVAAERAEDLLKNRQADVITARALAPLSRALGFFGPSMRRGSRVLLYKGPDIDQEIADAAGEARRHRIRLRVVMRYELPDSLGCRTLVEAADYATVELPR